MSGKKILIIEDDAAIRRGIVDGLIFEGYRATEAESQSEGFAQARTNQSDLILLDLMLPGGDGLEILQAIRKNQPKLPVIILTARGSEADRVKGLRLGADDYVTKPFSMNELLARIEAVLRRSTGASAAQFITIPQGSIDLERREVCFDDGTRSELSEREVELIRYLAQNRTRAVSRDEILLELWGLKPGQVKTRTIDMHIARIREKLRDNSANPRIVLTVHGKGYMLCAGTES